MDSNLDFDLDLGGDDEDFEAELLALQGESGGSRHARQRPRVPPGAPGARASPDDDDDDDGDGDDELMAELNYLIGSDEHAPSTAAAAKEVLPAKEVVQTKEDAIKEVVPENDVPAEMSVMDILVEREAMYQQALSQAEQNDTSKARRFGRALKSLRDLKKQAASGKPVDTDTIPPPVHTGQKKDATSAQGSTKPAYDEQTVDPSPTLVDNKREVRDSSPTEHNTVTKAIEQSSSHSSDNVLYSRRDEYKSAALALKQKGDIPGAKKLFVIAKKFDNVIAAFEAGENVDLSAMPPPAADYMRKLAPPPRPPKPVKPAQKTGESETTGTMELLTTRQKEYKLAALDAKRKGHIDQAREFLKLSKGFDNMIESLQVGLRIDISDIPPSPAPVVDDETVADDVRLNKFKIMEELLNSQLKLCAEVIKRSEESGDEAVVRRFGDLKKKCSSDLKTLRSIYVGSEPLPSFRRLSIAIPSSQSCPELGENDLVLDIVRGINFVPPAGFTADGMDTYVKFTFPYPQDAFQEGKTNTIRGTVNPDYSCKTELKIDRKARAFSRAIKIKSLKLQVLYRRGFLKADGVLGSVNVKLSDLEDKCDVRQTLDLLDGRRPCGGKLEVQMRIRDPIGGKKMANVQHEWITF